MAWEGRDWQKLDSIDKSLKSMIQSYNRLLDRFDVLTKTMADIKTAIENVIVRKKD